MSKPVLAIVGRPNVGKSTLFNKIAGTRISIVDDTPGVTRDRIFVDAEWLGRSFLLIDTGGIEPKNDDEILVKMRLQAELAIEMADVVVLMTNVKEGLTAADKDVAAMLIKANKPVIVAVNKVDNPGEPPMDFYEFYNLGLGDPIAISSTHGLGVGDLLDEVISHIPEEEFSDDDFKIISGIEDSLREYIFNCQFSGIAPKILVTYDSLKYVLGVIGQDIINYSIIVDEFQNIFMDSRFKASTELNFINYLQEAPFFGKGTCDLCSDDATIFPSEKLK